MNRVSIRSSWVFVLAQLVCLVSSPVRADVTLVSNLAEPFRASTPIANPEYWAAQSFYVDGYNRNLLSISAIVGNGFEIPNVVAQLRLADLNGDIDTTPGGLLTTFTAPDMSGLVSARLFAPDTLVTLNALEKYWFILGSSNDGTFDWSYADSNNFVGPGALGNFADSSDAGATWRHHVDDFPYFIRAGVSAVPEPGCASVMVSIVSGYLLGNRRRRRLVR